MLLAAVSDIVEDLGFDSMTDINVAASMALDAATSVLASLLNTDFDQATLIDTFFVRFPPYRNGPAVQTEFRLNQGLVTSVLSAKSASKQPAFTDAASVTDVSSAIVWDLTKGVGKDFTTHYVDQFVQISYVCGFPVSSTDPISYDLTVVPDWLQNAAKTRAMIDLADSAVLAEASIKLDKHMLGLKLNALLSRRLRYAPMALLPL